MTTVSDRRVQQQPTRRAENDAPQRPRTADELRAQIAQWAIQQANDPNIGYSQTAGRFGNATDANGHRYFDCSGLVFTAYKQAGIELGGNWTGAMRDTWRSWADQVPKDMSQMKPGDLILMDGHVVMYTGNGRCVGAQTSHAAFGDQVTANIDAAHYLSRPDAIVLRPRISDGQLANAPAQLPLQPQTGPMVSSGGGSSSSSSSGASSAGGYSGSSGYSASGSSSPAPVSSGSSSSPFGFDIFFLMQLLALMSSGDPQAAQMLASMFPNMPPEQLAMLTQLLQADPKLRDKVAKDPALLEKLAKSPAEVKRLLEAAAPAPQTPDSFAAARTAPVSMPTEADGLQALQVDPAAIDPSLVSQVRAGMMQTIQA